MKHIEVHTFPENHAGPGGYGVSLRAIGLPLVMMVMLCACAARQPLRNAPDPIKVPSTWSLAVENEQALTSAATLAQWWLQFEDSLLNDLVSESLLANTTVNSARAALAQARARRDIAAAALWPSLGSSASVQRSRGGGQRSSNDFQAALDASWELDAFGGNQSALQASDAAAGAVAANLGDAQVQMTAEVGLNYILLRSAQRRFIIAGDNLSAQEETLQIVRWRQQAGLASALDTEQARALVERTRALLPLLQTSVEQTKQALAVLAGRPPAAMNEMLAAPGLVPRISRPLAISMPAETLRRRADVRAAEFEVTAAANRVGVAEAARLPRFNIGGSLGLNALTLGALTNGASVFTSLLAGVSLPVFDHGAARAQVRVEEGALAQTQQTYRAVVLGALKEVENALVAMRGDRMRLLSLRLAADAAANANTLARQQYSSGLVDFQTVLDTQRTRLEAQDSMVSAEADLSADHVRLYTALGGGWRPELTLPLSRPADSRNAVSVNAVSPEATR